MSRFVSRFGFTAGCNENAQIMSCILRENSSCRLRKTLLAKSIALTRQQFFCVRAHGHPFMDTVFFCNFAKEMTRRSRRQRWSEGIF